MKKLLFALPLLLVGCAEVGQAAKDGLNEAKEMVVAPPSFVVEAINAILRFFGNVLSAGWDMFISKFLPF